MNIQEYVKMNYDKLPKSYFDGFEVVVIKEILNENYGWGHHSYQGLAVDASGYLWWCYSSGCSCSGGPWYESTAKDIKVLQVENGFDIPESDNFANFNFNDIQVVFNYY